MINTFQMHFITSSQYFPDKTLVPGRGKYALNYFVQTFLNHKSCHLYICVAAWAAPRRRRCGRFCQRWEHWEFWWAALPPAGRPRPAPTQSRSPGHAGPTLTWWFRRCVHHRWWCNSECLWSQNQTHDNSSRQSLFLHSLKYFYSWRYFSSQST